MAKQPKAWMLKPAKTSKTSIPDAIKSDLETKAANLIENVLKPKYVVPQKPDIEFKGVIRSRLTVFVVAHQSPAIVRRQHLGRRKVLACERTFA